MKTKLLALVLTTLGLWPNLVSAATTPSTDAAAAHRWDAVSSGTFEPLQPGATDTNREELLRQMMRRTIEGKAVPTTKEAGTLPASQPQPNNAALTPSTPPVTLRSATAPAVPATNTPPALVDSAALVAQAALPGASPNPQRPGVRRPPVANPAGPGVPPANAGQPSPVSPGQTVPAPGTPTPVVPAATANEPVTVISPRQANTNANDEILPAGVINFPATDLNQVLQIYSELVNRTILRPTSLPAPTITLKTQTPLTKKEAIEAFDAVLQLNGIGLVNIGDKFVEVVALPQIHTVGSPIVTNPAVESELSDLGKYITYVAQLHYVKPSEMVPVLQPFASAIPNPIMPIDASQSLVLRDFSVNVKRMLEMIKQVDVAVPAEFISEVIPIKYALAADIASALNSLSSGGGGTSVGGSTGGAGRTSSFGGSRGGGFGGGGGNNFGRSGFGSQYGGQNQYGSSPFGQQGNITPQATTTPVGQQPGSFSQRLQNIINKAAGGPGEFQILGQTKIIADERTNSLLIFAGRDDMKTIKDIIVKLDVVLAQVLIEAVIVQVSLNDSRNLGFSYQEASSHGLGNYFKGIGAINNGNALSGSSFLSGAGTNAAGSLPGGFSYFATFGNDFNATMTAIESDSRAKILQRPRIQTSHAVPATLFVGESRPYPTGSYYGGGAYGGYSSIQQMQIGVSLEVTPLINPDGLVVMDIHQKIDSVSGTVNIANVGDVPVTSSKEAQAKVAVRDHDTIMLGGLIESDKNTSNSGVPYLKDIPLLGLLFRSTQKSESRNELIVLIRPTVLPTPEVAALAARAEQEKMPGVRKAEVEQQIDEVKRAKAAEKDLKGKDTLDLH